MAAFAKCHYKVLGVERNATIDDIKKAYKKLALEMHPDKNLDRPEEAKREFQALQRAHEILTNPQARALYDKDQTDLHEAGAPPTTPEENPSHSRKRRGFYSYAYPSATKRRRAITPIQDLKISNSLHGQLGKLTIRGRVTNKTDVKKYSNSRGGGIWFSMDLLDDSGEIRMTAFNTPVELFYEMIHVNHVYYISCFNVKTANKQFTSIKNDCELTFNNDTQVRPCAEDTSDIPLRVTYDFVTIANIEHVDTGKIIDVIGVCKSVGDCQNVTERTTGKELKKRELVLIDQTRKKIVLTLWGKAAEDFYDDAQPIIAVKGVKVSNFKRKSLSCLSSSLFQVNPDLEKARAMRKWYHSEGNDTE